MVALEVSLMIDPFPKWPELLARSLSLTEWFAPSLHFRLLHGLIIQFTQRNEDGMHFE
jgi:hypothetical protein